MMGPDAGRNRSQIAIRVHPPERRRRAPGIAACGCCCTTCCCLHSLGGLIGAATAGWPRTVEDRRATVTYWCCLLALFTGALCVGWFSESRGDPVLLILVLLLPGIQIAASVVAAIIARIIAGPKAPWRIWSITWRGFVGAVIGVGILWVVSQVLFGWGAR